jgi:hypothetical protein
MESEGSLLYSQEPATGPYTEPDKSNHYMTQTCSFLCTFTCYILTLRVELRSWHHQ